MKKKSKKIKDRANRTRLKGKKKRVGLDRDLNPGPRAPEARIIPLDHQAIDVGMFEPVPFEPILNQFRLVRNLN